MNDVIEDYSFFLSFFLQVVVRKKKLRNVRKISKNNKNAKIVFYIAV